MEGKVLEVNNLTKTYGSKGFQTKVLKGISLSICERDFIAIMGPSGSGKTTLLNMLSTIDKPTHGSVILDGKDITKIHNKELSKIRRDKVGFIFQDYNLLDTMSIQDNIALPLSLNGVPASECIARTRQMGAMFGLKEHLEKYPYQLSGGQKQRAFGEISVSIVRRAKTKRGSVPGVDYKSQNPFCRRTDRGVGFEIE